MGAHPHCMQIIVSWLMSLPHEMWLQDEDEHVLRTGDAFQSGKNMAQHLLDTLANGPKQGG